MLIISGILCMNYEKCKRERNNNNKTEQYSGITLSR